jgi:hypothetical protein
MDLSRGLGDVYKRQASKRRFASALPCETISNPLNSFQLKAVYRL